MPITKIRKEPKVSASNVNVSPGQQLDDALTAIGAALDAKANAADVAAVTGQRSNLNTTDKTNLVAAINEVNDNIPTSYDELTNKPIVKTSDNGFVIVADGANRANKATAQNAFAEGGKTEATGTSSHAEGDNTLAEGSGSHSEGQGTQAAGIASHAEGLSTLARGANSHVEGNYTETVDSSAHAEGKSTVAYGIASHAEGSCMWSDIIVSRAYAAGDSYIYVNREVNPGFVISNNTQTVGVQNCVLQEQDDYRLSLEVAFTEDIAANEILSVAPSAYGSYSHTEGSFTVAMGDSSHAEGSASKALGDYSHAEGLDTKTTNIAEHASGKYNKSTPNVTQFSVGIGADEEHRANAYEVTTDGKMYVKGVGGYDGTNVTATGVKALGESGWASGSISYNDLTNKPIVKTADNGYTIGEYAGAMATDAIGLGAGQAIGSLSLAEGYGSLTFGQGSHAEGRSVASGAGAHAEGMTTYSWSQATHTEGYNTVSMWYYSHAEGSNVLASGLAAHAEGLGFVNGSKITPAKRFHLIVYNDRIEFKNDEGISIHDILYQPVLQLDSDSEYAQPRTPLEVISYNSATNVVLLRNHALYMEGDYALFKSYKSEEGTTITCAILKSGAQGNFSHVEGNNTRALVDGAHAEGIETKALGLGSHAEGNNSDERFEVTVTDDTVMSDSSSQDTTVILNSFTGSVPVSDTFINVEAGIAIARVSYIKDNSTNHIFLRVKGAGVNAETESPYIILAYAQETAGYTIPAGSAIEIYYSGALGSVAHAEGDSTTAFGLASHAEGEQTVASGDYSHAEGYLTTASGTNSHAEGDSTTAFGLASHAEGHSTKASGYYSHAEGYLTKASGTNSHAEGYGTTALGAQAHTGGYFTTASGSNSHAEGYRTTASADNSFVCGKYNKPDSTTLFAVGYGTQSKPKDAVHVDYDGSVYIQGIGGYDGTNITGTGVESVQKVIARLERALGGNNS